MTRRSLASLTGAALCFAAALALGGDFCRIGATRRGDGIPFTQAFARGLGSISSPSP